MGRVEVERLRVAEGIAGQAAVEAGNCRCVLVTGAQPLPIYKRDLLKVCRLG